jgi:hypothetical protein
MQKSNNEYQVLDIVGGLGWTSCHQRTIVTARFHCLLPQR